MGSSPRDPRTPAAVRTLATPVGPARVHVHPSRTSGATATVVLGHGAGGGVAARDLAALAAALPAAGYAVVLVEQPWRVAGRRVAGPPAQLDAAWRAVLAGLDVSGPLVVGGRSAGARVACRTAAGAGAAAVVALAFPLHPPGRPERSRAQELLASGAPTLVVQGERDPFGRPGELPPGPDVAVIPTADHGFAVPRSAVVTQAEALTLVCAAVRRFLDGKIRPGGRR
ncbi:MAG: hydrolase [Actinomycetia bacterium]|nr:hydrolase [Actinomycetes bacterium]